jgi:polar amino acid transport system substrate-binding protein
MKNDIPLLCGPRFGPTVRKWAGLLSPALLFAASLCHGAAAVSPIEVTIYADDGYPPYSYGENGEASGIYTAILNKAFERMPQYRVTLVPVPWKRGLRLLESGQGFALYPPYFRPEERPYIRYSEPILDEQVVVFCNRFTTANRNLKNWPDDYTGLTIGTNAGFLLGGKEFDRYVAAGKIVRDSGTSSHGSVLKMISGRNDCYINDRLAIRWQVEQIKRNGEIEAERVAIFEAARLYSEKGHLGYTDRDEGRFAFKDSFVQEFNAAITSLKSDGEIDRMVEKFLSGRR